MLSTPTTSDGSVVASGRDHRWPRHRVPPSWFRTTSAVYSSFWAPDIVATWYRKGFAAFHSKHHPSVPKNPWTDVPVLATHAPFEESSLISSPPTHHRAAPALLPFIPKSSDERRVLHLRVEREPTNNRHRSIDHLSIRPTRPGTSTDRISSACRCETTLGIPSAEAENIHRAFPRMRKRTASPTRLSRAIRLHPPHDRVAPVVSYGVDPIPGPTSLTECPLPLRPTVPSRGAVRGVARLQLHPGRGQCVSAPCALFRLRFPSLLHRLPCVFARGDA
jgi:hypothetical protein